MDLILNELLDFPDIWLLLRAILNANKEIVAREMGSQILAPETTKPQRVIVMVNAQTFPT